MSMLTKLQPVFIVVSSILGIVLGTITTFGDYSSKLIQPSLMALLFIVFLSIDLRGIKRAFLNYKFTITSLIINFVWTPVFAILLNQIFLNGSMALQIGFLMLLVTPCTDWYLVFTGISKGNVTLGAAVLPLNILLQIMLLPVYLFLFVGDKVAIDTISLLGSILFVLIIPMVSAQLIRTVFIKRDKVRSIYNVIMRHSDPIQMMFLYIAVIAMFASEGKSITSNPILLLKMLPPLICFFVLDFVISYIIARWLKIEYADAIPLILVTLARNSPLSLAVAVTAFSSFPLIPLVLVIGPLIELPVLGLVSYLLLKIGDRKDELLS